MASQIYREGDKPFYRRENKVLLGLVAWNVSTTIFVKVDYLWRNKSREKIWNDMTAEQEDLHIKTTKNEGNKGLDFHFDQ